MKIGEMSLAPQCKAEFDCKYYIPQYKDISGVYCASPDTGCISNALAYNVQTDDVGKYVEIQVPSLEYWDMIYIRYNDNTLTDTVEAENSILTNVSTNNNHGGYSGTGFVDSYGKAGDAVTMDFFVPETGDYKLSFVYSAAVDGTPKRELYINAYGYDSISFPATSNWRNGIQAKLRFISVRVFNVWWFTAAMQMTDTSILTAFIFPNPLKGV